MPLPHQAKGPPRSQRSDQSGGILDALKYILAVAVGAFVAGIGAITFVDERIARSEKFVPKTQAENFASKVDQAAISQRVTKLEEKPEVWFSEDLDVSEPTPRPLGLNKFCTVASFVAMSADQNCGCNVKRAPDGTWTLTTVANPKAREGAKCHCQAACIK